MISKEKDENIHRFALSAIRGERRDIDRERDRERERERKRDQQII